MKLFYLICRNLRSAFRRLHLEKSKSQKQNIPAVPMNLTPQEMNILEESVKLAANELKLKFKIYEKNPESHPVYFEEWKAFWSRRYNELVANGKDVEKHGFKSEWILFWPRRMKELLKIEIEEKRELLRKSFKVPLMDLESFKTLKNFEKVENVEILDESENDHSIRSNESGSKRYRMENPHASAAGPFRRTSEYELFIRRNNFHANNLKRLIDSDKIDDEPVNVISVCRFLSALEDDLGMLAKAVNNLLSQAIALDMIKSNSADEILLNSDNCNVLETVKEKFKGILSANLADAQKKTALQHAVQIIAILMHNVSSREQMNVPEINSSHQEDTLKDNVLKAISENLQSQGIEITAEEQECLFQSLLMDQLDCNETIFALNHEQSESPETK